MPFKLIILPKLSCLIISDISQEEKRYTIIRAFLFDNTKTETAYKALNHFSLISNMLLHWNERLIYRQQ
ncbi:hypothetical protein CEV08_03390 [Bartonella tribocorum]|uniref:Uncharacterized protein n=1 Tax=Bartonella tribocorum TaxID=85701 RepID=A0A2M6UWN0_9HYPH|nr:hypothetical protein CEV08_03390 [Bartonella tribocorum]